MIASQKSRQWPVPHHMPHGNVHQRDQETKGCDQTALHNRCLPVFQGIFIHRSTFTFCSCICPFYRSTVSCCLNRCNNLRLRCSSFYSHRIRQKTHRTACNARHLRYCLFYSAAAGSTAHSCYCILFHKIHLTLWLCRPFYYKDFPALFS